MTLPFVDPNQVVKKFQCFVCGVILDNYDLFKTHIIERHEEGREYLLCPLLHCQAPVRELGIHFKTRHPSTTLPKNIQHRVSVMYDTRSPDGRKKKVSFKSGFFESEKNKKPMHYRSSWEETVYKLLEVRGDVLSYDVEPFKVAYHYARKEHNYFPDLIVKYVDGRIEVMEIKPSNQTNLKQNQAKWQACEYFCKLRGWVFTVVTETVIEKMKKDCLNG